METNLFEEIQLVKSPIYSNSVVLMKMFFT